MSAMQPTMLAALCADLAPKLGERLMTSASALARYGESEGPHGGHLPDLVVRARTIEDVQAVVAAAAARGAPIVAYGAGTSLEGNAAAAGGVCLDLSEMNQILEVRAEDLFCVVEPGVTREGLNAALRGTGLFFPVDPGANATLGGMISTRASGTTAVRYGTMRENTLALKVVTADGRLVATGTRARKSAAGYDLTHLFCGAEGTLGIVVEATLRLHGQPEAILAGVQAFKSVAAAVETVIAVIQIGLPVARIELLDVAALRACNRASQLSLAEAPTLFIELHGAPGGLREQAGQFADLAASAGAIEAPIWASAPEERTRLWTARHRALPSARAMVPGATTWVTDICVPISHLADAIGLAQREIEAAGLFAPILGHVGDGNFHVIFVLAPNDHVAWAKAEAINAAMIEHALSVGGTCTGEHGIGLGKREALLREHGGEAVALMRTLKAALDPCGLMNPGKIFI